MPAQKTLPIVGTQGNITHPLLVGGVLFQHYFLTDDSRTRMFDHQTSSVTYDIQVASDSDTEIATRIEKTLGGLYRSYFENVDISATPDEGKIILEINYTAADGATYNLKRAIEYDGGTVERLIEFNNLGEVTNMIDLTQRGVK